MMDPEAASEPRYRFVIRSVGTAAAGVVGVLRQALPFSEERLAAGIYQAPAELLGHLDQTTAEALARALMTMGLEAETLGPSETFTAGGPDYDVALAIRARIASWTPPARSRPFSVCPSCRPGKSCARAPRSSSARSPPIPSPPSAAVSSR